MTQSASAVVSYRIIVSNCCILCCIRGVRSNDAVMAQCSWKCCDKSTCGIYPNKQTINTRGIDNVSRTTTTTTTLATGVWDKGPWASELASYKQCRCVDGTHSTCPVSPPTPSSVSWYWWRSCVIDGCGLWFQSPPGRTVPLSPGSPGSHGEQQQQQQQQRQQSESSCEHHCFDHTGGHCPIGHWLHEEEHWIIIVIAIMDAINHTIHDSLCGERHGTEEEEQQWWWWWGQRWHRWQASHHSR